jgi:putative oxidoreductase
MVAACELSYSTLLALSLATRLAMLPLLGMIVVIQTFVYPYTWAEHLTWGSIVIFPLTRGRGPLSLDCLVGLSPRRRTKHRGKPHTKPSTTT